MARFFSESAFRASRSAPAQHVEQKGVRDAGAWSPGPHRANSDLRSGELCGRRQPSPVALWNRCMQATSPDEEFMNSPHRSLRLRALQRQQPATDPEESFPSRSSIFELPGCRVSSPSRGRCPQGWRGCGGVALPVRGWYNRTAERARGPSLAPVRCTGPALRRPSALSLIRREEGCFSPAVVRRTSSRAAAWNDPADRGPAALELVRRTAGPRAFHALGRVVDPPGFGRLVRQRGRAMLRPRVPSLRRCPCQAPTNP
jgi:hypothetical protein